VGAGAQDPQEHGRRIQDDLCPTDAATVAATWDSIRDQLAAAFPKIGPLMDEAKTEVLAFTVFPATTGPRCGRPTRWNGSTRRSNAEPAWSASFRTSPPSSAILADTHDEWQVSDRRYLSEGCTAQLKPTSNNETVPAISASD
jgi:putative transposase